MIQSYAGILSQGGKYAGATKWTVTASGDWTAPVAGVYNVTLYGGGGGGGLGGKVVITAGSGSASKPYVSYGGGAGGGGGGASKGTKNGISLKGGEVVKITIGAAGAAATESADAKAGGSTSFGSYFTVTGGGAGGPGVSAMGGAGGTGGAKGGDNGTAGSAGVNGNTQNVQEWAGTGTYTLTGGMAGGAAGANSGSSYGKGGKGGNGYDLSVTVTGSGIYDPWKFATTDVAPASANRPAAGTKGAAVIELVSF